MAVSSVSSLSSDAFLQLFVTQLKHQDPTSPMDPGQMMAQLAQLSTVQELTAMNESFGKALQTEQLGLARNMIGQQVAYTTDNGILSGVVEGAEVYGNDVGVRVGGSFVNLDAITQILAASPSVVGQ